MIIGGFLIAFGTRHLTAPIIEVSNAAKEIAQGNFQVEIPREEKSNPSYEYVDEIDELADHFNRMAKELNRMDYMRKEFMSNVSHEVKTPAAAITGFTEILIDGGLTEEEEKEYLALVNEESIRLSSLCENMLRMSRLDNQVIVGIKDYIRIDEQLRKAAILLSDKWQGKQIDFEVKLEENRIMTNQDLLLEVWINLIDNAIKYSNEGGSISISEYRRENRIIVEIADEGIGMKKEKIPKIFDQFYQCEESHKKKGNGLGLSIVKRIVHMLSGEISCESEYGKGTRMTVSLPDEEHSF
ncbi:sensor histidine kinase [Lachnospiraceae bacterium KM106-2]|nr:sensor histidine kinase [Lachnospiraceae bacterium KM106-2]